MQKSSLSRAYSFEREHARTKSSSKGDSKQKTSLGGFVNNTIPSSTKENKREKEIKRMRRSCVGVLADSSKRRDAGAPAVCLGVPFRERDDGSWDDDHADDDDENEKAKMNALGRRRNGDENVGWKFACVG